MTDERLEHLRGCGSLLNGLKIVECVDEIDRLKHEIQILLILTDAVASGGAVAPEQEKLND